MAVSQTEHSSKRGSFLSACTFHQIAVIPHRPRRFGCEWSSWGVPSFCLLIVNDRKSQAFQLHGSSRAFLHWKQQGKRASLFPEGSDLVTSVMGVHDVCSNTDLSRSFDPLPWSYGYGSKICFFSSADMPTAVVGNRQEQPYAGVEPRDRKARCARKSRPHQKSVANQVFQNLAQMCQGRNKAARHRIARRKVMHQRRAARHFE